MKHLEKHKVLTTLNHGFRSGYSCETQLLVTMNDLMKAYDTGTQTDVAILDFSKAFDTVPHNMLLHKIESYGIRGPINNWLRMFLTKRTMKVVVEGEHSEEFNVDSGVPQGTVLGPILFLCHINDLPDSVKSSVRLFADDCLLYRNIKTADDHNILQADLKNLEVWAENWGMRFNAKKCYILSIRNKSQRFYSLNGHILQQVQNNPYLGLQISEDLKWTTHIANVTKKANSTLGFLRRNLRHCPKDCKKLAYISLVRSTMEYGAIIWDPFATGEINKLERVQRQAARFITGDYKSRDEGCVTNMLARLELQELRDRRTSQRLIFMYKVVEGLVPAIEAEEYLKPARNKRLIRTRTFSDYQSTNIIDRQVRNNSKCFEVPSNNTQQYSNSFFVKTVIDWNKLEDTVVNSTSVESFKTALTGDH